MDPVVAVAEPEPARESGLRHNLYVAEAADIPRITLQLKAMFGPLYVGQTGTVHDVEDEAVWCRVDFKRYLTAADVRRVEAIEGVIALLRPFDTRYRIETELEDGFPVHTAFCRICEKSENSCKQCGDAEIPVSELWNLSNAMERAGIPDGYSYVLIPPDGGYRGNNKYWRLPGGAMVEEGYAGRCPLPNYFKHCAGAVCSYNSTVRGNWTAEEVQASGPPPAPVYDRQERSYNYTVTLPAGVGGAQRVKVMLRSYSGPLPENEAPGAILRALTMPRIYRECMDVGYDWETWICDRYEELCEVDWLW